MAASYGGCCSVLAVEVFHMLVAMAACPRCWSRPRAMTLTMPWQPLPPVPTPAGDDISRPATNAREAVQW